MTSKKSLKNKSNPSVFDLKRSFITNLFAPILSLITFSVIFVFLPIIFAISETNGSGEQTLKASELISQIRNGFNLYLIPSMMSSDGFIIIAIGIAIGILAGLIAFRFVNSKRRVNVYYSFGISRKKLFNNRAVAVLSMLFVSVLIPIIIDVIINSYLFGFSIHMISYGAIMLFAVFVAEGTAFGITAIAMSCSGTLPDSILLSSSMILAPTALLFTMGNIIRYSLNGYPAFTNCSYSYFVKSESLVSFLSILNPVFFLKGTKGTSVNDTLFNTLCIYKNDSHIGLKPPELSYVFPVILWLGITSVIIVIARNLFIKRKTEYAGMVAVNKAANSFSSIVMALFFGGIPVILGYSEAIGAFSILIAVVLTVIIYFLMQLMITRNFKAAIKEYKPIFSCATLFIAFGLIISCGAFGYSSYVPEPSNIKEAYVSIPVCDEFLYTDNCAGSYGNEAGEALNAATPIGPFTSSDDLKKVCSIMDKVVNDEDDIIKYSISVNYKLNNGKTIKRQYNRINREALKSLLSLTDSDAYNKTLDAIFSKDDYMKFKLNKNKEEQVFDDYMSTIKYTNYYLHKNSMSIVSFDGKSHGDIGIPDEELMSALCADLKDMTWEERYNPSNQPVAILASCGANDESLQTLSDMQIGYFSTFYVYPTMKRTTEYINRHKLLEKLKTDSPIKKIAYTSYSNVIKNFKSDIMEEPSYQQYYSYQFISGSSSYFNDYESIEDGDEISIFDSKNVITDKNKIAEIQKAVYPSYYVDEKGYLIGIYYEDGSYVGMYMPSSQAPSFIK